MLNCAYDGPAPQLTNETGLQALKEECSMFYNGKSKENICI
mgnify:FL=1